MSGDICEEFIRELWAQDKKWGEQNHPSVPDIGFANARCTALNLPTEEDAKHATDTLMKSGGLTFSHIVVEELCEAISADDDAARRVELVQLGACVMNWIGAIDRRAGR